MANIKIADTIGTEFMGFVTATVDQLLELLGPADYADDIADKVTTEWKLKTDDGIVFAVYDYDYTGGECRNGKPYRWHIGGFDKDALRAVERVTGLPVESS